MKQKQIVKRTQKQKVRDFIETGKCFNDKCDNKTFYTKHGRRPNKSSIVDLVKCSKCNSVFGVKNTDYV